MKPKAYSIGIDQSANHTGVVILSETGELLRAAPIEPKRTGLPRLVYVRGALREILEEAPGAHIGVWESYAIDAVNQAFLLGEIGGVVQLALYDHAALVECCAPLALKKFVAGNARASKTEMMQAVFARWGVQFDDDNLADAYGLAQLGRYILDPKPALVRKQLEVRAKILAPKKKRKGSFRMNKQVL